VFDELQQSVVRQVGHRRLAILQGSAFASDDRPAMKIVDFEENAIQGKSRKINTKFSRKLVSQSYDFFSLLLQLLKILLAQYV
jgi:hypothetical protein